MKIQAKFPGTCRICHGMIFVGEPIEWVKGATATHYYCFHPKKEERSARPILNEEAYIRKMFGKR